jgi:hypothetical protein
MPEASMTSAKPSHKGLMLVARELLIDLERDIDLLNDKVLPLPPAVATAAASSATASIASSSSSSAPPGDGGGRDDRHKKVLLTQIDELREALLAEQSACEQLRCENSQLAHDVRSLASQLKQERAASNAMIEKQASGAMHGPTGEVGGELTLASAASQILLLRREVKFLQKQWNSARVDQKQASTREQIQQLRDEADEARRAAAAEQESAAAHAAKGRILLRELSAARAQVRAQQQRMRSRSGAQREVAALKEQLAKAQDAYVEQQQRLKQLELRDRIRARAPARGGGGGGGIDDDEFGGDGEDGIDGDAEAVDASAAEAEAAYLGLGLLVLSNELTALERMWMAEKGGAAELVAIKANMSFRVAQVEDDNAGLQAEVQKLRARISALQEEKEIMQTSLNALNIDLANESVETQQAAATAAAAAEHAVAAEDARPPPPPPPPPPEKKMSEMGKAVSKNMNSMGKGMSAGMSKFMKKKANKEALEPGAPAQHQQ